MRGTSRCHSENQRSAQPASLGSSGCSRSCPAAQAADDARIDGRVLGGAAATPLLDAGVNLSRLVEPGGTWQQVGFDWTDVDGRYRFSGLAAGTYRVCVSSSEGIGPNPEPLYARRCWIAATTIETANDIVLDVDEVVRRIDVRGLPVPASAVT